MTAAAAQEAVVNDENLEKRMSELSDVELIRLLTTDKEDSAPGVLTVAEAEANRRGLPIDEAFIPAAAEDDGSSAQLARFEAGGRAVACAHCGNDRFETRETLLNTRGLTFMNLDWLNRSATALVCGNCGLVQLFATAPEALDETE